MAKRRPVIAGRWPTTACLRLGQLHAIQPWRQRCFGAIGLRAGFVAIDTARRLRRQRLLMPAHFPIQGSLTFVELLAPHRIRATGRRGSLCTQTAQDKHARSQAQAIPVCEPQHY